MNLRLALAGGLTGALTIEAFLLALYAWLGLPIIRLNQSDAAHLLGRSAYDGGWQSAILGFVLHLLVSLVWGVLCFLLMQRLPLMRRHVILSGVLFGLVVMVVMNWIVLPFTQEPMPHVGPRIVFIIAVAHTVFFGIPVVAVNALNVTSAEAAKT